MSSLIESASPAAVDLRDRYHLLFRTLPVGIVFQNRDGEITAANPAAEKILGLTWDQMRGRTSFDPRWRALRDDGTPFPGEEHPSMVTLRTGKPVFRVTMGIYNPVTDTTRWILVTSTPIFADGRQPAEVYTFFEDITASRDAEARSRARDDLFRDVVQHTPDCVYIKDTEGRYLVVNDATVKAMAMEREQILGHCNEDLLPPDISRALREQDDRALAGEIVSVEGIGPQGRQYHILKFPWRNAAGVLGGVVGIARDLTETKQLERQYLHAQRMEVVGRLAGGVAHDFNNLLTVINGCCDLLLELAPGEEVNSLVTEVRNAGERASNLTRQLLAFSRQQVLRPMVLQLNNAVDDATKMLRRLIGEDVVLTTSLDPKAAPVKIDPGQLEQVLINLAVNARDAMPHGGNLRIEVRDVVSPGADMHADVPPGRYTRLSVADTGTGIDETLRGKIFEPFFTTKGVGQGTGLGLATVHGIVTQSGGHVRLDSTVGAGTTFSIYLPAETVSAPVASAGTGPSALPRGTETVLLVEDESTVRGLGREVLQACGYTVIEAEDGADALGVALRTPQVDLLVTDVVMPRMGGRQLAQHILQRWPKCKVLFVSGYTDDALTRSGITLGEIAFLQKPFTPRSLARKVREVLDAEQ